MSHEEDQGTFLMYSLFDSTTNTSSSVTVNFPASDARMTVWSVLLVYERRWNTSSCLEGMWEFHPIITHCGPQFTYTQCNSYAEVLENTQFALIATVHKLYSMVRNNQSWDLGEPELNDRGQPVIHNIAQKLGCIRPNSDIDLPVHSVFPEDEAGMAELARQLEDQQKEHEPHKEAIKDTDSSVCNRTERASSSELDHSDVDIEYDYRKAAFGNTNAMTLSPQSFTGSPDFDFAPPPPEIDASTLFPSQSPSMNNFPAWPMIKPQLTDLTMQFLQQQQQSGMMANMDMLNQGLVESEFGTIKPHVLSCPNPEVMLGMGDPMIYSGYDGEPMRL